MHFSSKLQSGFLATSYIIYTILGTNEPNREEDKKVKNIVRIITRALLRLGNKRSILSEVKDYVNDFEHAMSLLSFVFLFQFCVKRAMINCYTS